ncbi:hypothetical protein QVD17_16044 [Tagetes erecta]|uniref:Cytochrome P450 n=1 Tax=Tagetes erecta TaxID=13708 RepID=A0AAD8KU99_TARER|nr:hypothetical protein QVD17_16044 [Tagetes erecta]
MNYSLEWTVLSLSLLLIIFYVKFTRRSNTKSTEREVPEPDGAWPIIGHLYILGRSDQLLHRTLGAMADKYGPAFNIRLGTRPAFVISSWEVAKECFTVNDKAVSSRPQTVSVKHMSYNGAMLAFAPYTPFWREMRKIVILELLSNRRIEMMKDVRSLEINFGIKELFRRWDENSKQPVVVALDKWLEHMMLSMIVMMVAGKRYLGDGCDGEEAERCHKAIIEFFRLSGVFVVSDVIPSLRWLDLPGYEKQMKKTAKDFDIVLGGWLDEHRQKRKLDLERNRDGVKDFIDVMLSLEDEGKLSNMEHDSDTTIKSTCLALILGASDTTSVTLTWAISLLLNHPDVLKKLQHEIDDYVGKERQVEESDIESLVFLQAVIKETLRLYPPGPILIPRETMEDCTIAGYNVKAGTRLITNAWKLHRDANIWNDPCKYQPERFMGQEHKHVDLTGQKFLLIPFGSGRRSCPAATFAIHVLHLTLARLVHSFDLVQPGGLPVDMTEGPGLTTPKKNPLEVFLTPRLLPSVYGC